MRIEGGGLGRIRARLERITSEGNKRATGYAVAEVLTKGNQRARLAAIDRFGRRMPPRQKPRRDGARGPVMAPHHTRSRVIANYQARVTVSRWGWQVTAGWTGDVPWIRYHAEGRVIGAPIRDVMGVDPTTHREVMDTIRRMTLGNG
jgi:hypothetical protein